jgi:hypothetical protein
MKKQTILPLLFAATLIACNNDKTKDFIPGTYVNHAEGEYSAANDTLLIESQEENSFLIHRKVGFHTIRDGKPGKEQYEKEEWRATYNNENKTLTETSKGKVITPLPEANKLLVERSEYLKIN